MDRAAGHGCAPTGAATGSTRWFMATSARPARAHLVRRSTALASPLAISFRSATRRVADGSPLRPAGRTCFGASSRARNIAPERAGGKTDRSQAKPQGRAPAPTHQRNHRVLPTSDDGALTRALRRALTFMGQILQEFFPHRVAPA